MDEKTNTRFFELTAYLKNQRLKQTQVPDKPISLGKI
jgi:hypothetical protein